MGDVKELLRLLGQIDDELVSCMRCGMCQAVCPIYAETGLEAHVARGKIALLEGLAHEALKDPQAVMDRLDMCLLCGSCAAGCPSGVKVLDIFLKAKAFLAGYLGLPPAQKAILRGLLANRTVFGSVMTVAAKLQGLVTRPANEVIGTSCAVFGGILGGRHFMPLAKTAFHTSLPATRLPARSGQPTVAFFYGCMVDRMFPRIGQAVMKVLLHHGVGVLSPTDQVCCGIPALSAGDLKTFEKLVTENVAVFGDAAFDVLVTPCATCTSTIKKIWPDMCDGLPGEIRAKAKALAAKTMDISEFLVKNLGLAAPAALPAGGKKTKVTVHDPCHLKKSLGVFAEPRAVIAQNPEVEIVEMAASDACCGCGGSFTLKHYDISGRIGKRKRDAVVASGASVVTAGCPACLLQLSDMLSKAGDAVTVMHPVEIYAQALDQGGPGTGGNTP
ncbi:(Fe-S)-binding protein [Desulfolutivibrio sulfoxidireducens]|uniref:(Fe-S)-binding protein n=1 Tax=Desulfolutivibrio sulfoxidireducens TaxID=2773299 RepID=UPI00159DA66E|nr:(Fe-S)-binding protein [Desulfolutivibrio sulfoxidireducens]QLA17259.1 4Fe-4S dicluster domain-containing protein [Desulfolutivibrio sulfoxidireducens]